MAKRRRDDATGEHDDDAVVQGSLYARLLSHGEIDTSMADSIVPIMLMQSVKMLF